MGDDKYSLDDYEWKLTIEPGHKGGPGSGHWGHAGRPGQVGGSSSGGGFGRINFVFEGNVSGKAKQKAIAAYRAIPEWARKGVAEVKITAEAGFDFEAGGKKYEAAGSWDRFNNRITVYDANSYAEKWSHESLNSIMAHEVGHSLHERWWDTANEQDIASYRTHSEWFDMGGNVKPEFRTQWELETPMARSRQQFMKSWDSGEDGITPYSEAWARDGHWSETTAEMAKFYLADRYGGGDLGKGRYWLKAAGSSSAPGLSDAFEDALTWFKVNR